MNKHKLTINQNKLEVAVAIGFSLIIFILSSTNLGYIKISPHWNLDMGIIPAIFAAMIGGYRVGIPVAIVWSVIGYVNPDSNLQIYSLWGLMINKIVLVTIAYHAYKVCKKYYEYSPANVYRAIIAAITVEAIVSNITLTYMLYTSNMFEVTVWLRYAVQQYLLELALCSLAMMFLIKHLRQVHILNGIKRREKAIAESKRL
jgi:riboflavin transporter FmnP